MDIFLQLLLIWAGVTGFILASYIRYKKQRKVPLVCPLKSNCDTVVHSRFSAFLGIPVELIGMAYYLLIALGYSSFLILPESIHAGLSVVLLVSSTIALLFSVYLFFIQAFYLRQWCTWCLLSALLCFLIFILSVFGTGLVILPLLVEYSRFILGIHIVGLALGLGGATIADMLFFRFLKDFRITQAESTVLQAVTQIIWVGLAILVLSGLAMYIPQAEGYNSSSKFLVKMMVIGVIIINGSFLTLLISPQLLTIFTGAGVVETNKKSIRLRRIAFALGSISMTSWYSALTLGLLPQLAVSFWVIAGVYVFLLIGAVTTSQLIERIFTKKQQTAPVS